MGLFSPIHMYKFMPRTDLLSSSQNGKSGMSAPRPTPPSGAIPRRSFLTVAGIAIAGATAGAGAAFRPRTAAAHDPTCACLTSWSGVWAVAKASGKYVALAGKIDAGTLEIRELDVAADGKISVGGRYTVDFPAAFLPSTLFGVGDRMLVGGGLTVEADRIAVDYTANPKVLASPYLIGYNPEFDSGVVEVPLTTERPALFEIIGRELRELPLGVAVNGLGWGHVSDIASVAPDRIAVLVAGSTSYESAYGERALVAESVDAGRSWAGTTVAVGLGESWPGTLTVTGDALLAVTVSQDDRRTFHQRPTPTAPWTPVDAGPDGLVLGTVTGRSEVVVFDSNSDRVHRRSYSTEKQTWNGDRTPAQAAGRPVHAVLTIGGAPTEWIAVTDADARLVNEA